VEEVESVAWLLSVAAVTTIVLLGILLLEPNLRLVNRVELGLVLIPFFFASFLVLVGHDVDGGRCAPMAEAFSLLGVHPKYVRDFFLTSF
jgi:hypothetical protein